MSGTFVIAQGGGPTAVINQTMAGAVLEIPKRHPGARVLGARYGVRGIRDGDYVDLSDIGEDHTVYAAIADFTAHRSQIEQAKGMLMTIYGISPTHAFDILVWRSQETNTKLRTLVVQVIEDFGDRLNVPASIRERADHLLLTAHKRVDRPLPERTGQ